jgi:hypothetical protein
LKNRVRTAKALKSEGKKGKYGLAKKTLEQLKKVVEEDREYLEFIHTRACYERERLCNRRKVDYIS